MSPKLFFLTLVSFWIIWSGYFDPFHLSLGAISCALVYLWTKPQLSKKPAKLSQAIQCLIQFEKFSFWLLKEIVVANIDVFKLSISPNLKTKIEPKMFSFKTNISSESGQFILAQSITLTPGTVTTRISDQEFMIHALTKEAADALPGDMEKKVAGIFKEVKS